MNTKKVIDELKRRTDRLNAQRALYREKKGGKQATLAEKLGSKLSEEELLKWIQKVKT